MERLAFPAADDLFEETFRPLTGNFVEDEVCQIGGERLPGGLGPGLRCGRDFVRNIEVQLGHLSLPYVVCTYSRIQLMPQERYARKHKSRLSAAPSHWNLVELIGL